MGTVAPRVHRDLLEIERLKALQLALDGEVPVELQLRDGRVLRGTLPERPSLQQFFDPEGNEGTNGLLRFDRGDGVVDLFWIDEVADFTRIGMA